MNTPPVQFYKCLADETRLQALLLIVEEQELCVCELVEALDVSQPKISRHLAQLRECQLLTDRREGQWIFYSLNPELSEWSNAVLRITAENNKSYLADTLKRLNKMRNRPQRQQQCC